MDSKYYSWLIDKVYADYLSKYTKLLSILYRTPFRADIILMDENRESDGRDMRYRYAYENRLPDPDDDEWNRPVSILEVMAALAIKCEDLKYDYIYGDRTSYWFQSMLESLGVLEFDDWHYDSIKVLHILENFLNRNYAYNGEGGLFTIPNVHTDMRTVDIWCQAMWYLNTV